MPHHHDQTTAFDDLTQSEGPDVPDTAAAVDEKSDEFVRQIKETADKLVADGVSRGDIKLLNTAFRELRYCFKIFEKYRGLPKVTVFGSARTHPDHPAYQAAVAFGKRMAEEKYMVITGAANGIMEAGHVGAGRDMSFGVNIILPFEQGANAVITGDPKLMNMRYFFTRKLVFIKESDAVVMFPGGFGTMDEAFEALTLVQTGKTHIFPVVFVDQPGGTFWNRFQQFLEDDLLGNGYISPEDRALYKITDSIEEAVTEVTTFYRVYHSMRYVRGNLVLRLTRQVSDATMARLPAEFGDILVSGGFEQTGMHPQEANEPQIADLPRLTFKFNRHRQSRLRQLIDVLNQDE